MKMTRNKELENELIEIVNGVYDVDIRHKSRKRNIIDARTVFYNLLYNEGYSLTDIGRAMNKNHATVINGLKLFEVILKTDIQFNTNYNVCKAHFKIAFNNLFPPGKYTEKPIEELLTERVNKLKAENIALKKENNYLNSLRNEL